MHWTEDQIAGLAKAFHRFEPVVCPACGSHVAVDRMPLPLSGGASHLRFTCRGCRKTGELSGFVELAEDDWTEGEAGAIVAGFRSGGRVRCPRDGAALSPPSLEQAPAAPGSPTERVVCPICGRQAMFSPAGAAPAP